VKEVPHYSCVLRDLNLYCVFYCPHRGQVMRIGSDSA
jgi:hypothetical protein